MPSRHVLEQYSTASITAGRWQVARGRPSARPGYDLNASKCSPVEGCSDICGAFSCIFAIPLVLEGDLVHSELPAFESTLVLEAILHGCQHFWAFWVLFIPKSDGRQHCIFVLWVGHHYVVAYAVFGYGVLVCDILTVVCLILRENLKHSAGIPVRYVKETTFGTNSQQCRLILKLKKKGIIGLFVRCVVR